ncbi:hypothetical protein V525_03110 [Gordonia alkanivorans CGMCC 6845]|uniref:Uncharacterized protein n=1 Tax=Gordonia alkanivorans CGMCC 6845 TaxID=1423140 RepID=W9DIT6_9ACTN|nr:hypothetical protein V525_03110 [Gordonia alkanivorans CGMCC 6845]
MAFIEFDLDAMPSAVWPHGQRFQRFLIDSP